MLLSDTYTLKSVTPAQHVKEFSDLANSFGVSQDLALQDYVEASLMLQYNEKAV